MGEIDAACTATYLTGITPLSKASDKGQQSQENICMSASKYTIAIIGCGRLGQHYAEVYQTLPNTELVAIAEYNPERRRAVGERFGISALFEDAAAMYREIVPDIAAVVLPGKYIKEAVIASAQAGVRGVSTDKPIGACLADVDAMVTACQERPGSTVSSSGTHASPPWKPSVDTSCRYWR